MQSKKDGYHVHYGPAGGFARPDLAELWRYRDLIGLFIQRDFTVMYKQTILGPAWILINPLMTTMIYVVMFGTIAKLPTDGAPQILFYLGSTAVWSFFATSINRVAGTFTANAAIFSKVYFPRLTMPIASTLSAMINFGLQFGMFLILLVVYLVQGQVQPNWAALPLLPLLLAQVALLALGCGIIVSSLTTRYRDLVVVVSFGVQLWMYATPVVYPLSMIADPRLRLALCLNPMTAPVETFRYIFLGSGQVTPTLWAVALLCTAVLLIVGAALFSKVEKTFVDTV